MTHLEDKIKTYADRFKKLQRENERLERVNKEFIDSIGRLQEKLRILHDEKLTISKIILTGSQGGDCRLMIKKIASPPEGMVIWVTK
jgi:predicted nuclease with TOPRIM domain